MRRIGSVTLAAVALVAMGLPLAVPASAAPGPDESYLFVVDADHLRVVPAKGVAARIVLTGPSALRFSDRPYRHVRPMTLRAMLAEFGWTPTSLSLEDPKPNASVSLAGRRSQIVEIRQARLRDGKLVLSVLGIDGPLKRGEGPGSIFIDNVSDPCSTVQLTPDVAATVCLITTGFLQFAVTVTIAGTQYATLSDANPTAKILATVSGAVPTDLDLTVTLQFTSTGATVYFSGYAITDSPTPIKTSATITQMI